MAVRRIAAVAARSVLIASVVSVVSATPTGAGEDGPFSLVATYEVSGEVAEIVAATPDGRTLVYTDSQTEQIGFVDITDPSSPAEIGVLAMEGEPTSVAVTADGMHALVAVNAEEPVLAVVQVPTRELVATIPLDGQPDSVAIGPDGTWAAAAIENERDEDVDDGAMPQAPPGLLTVVELAGEPDAWTAENVDLTGLADRFPGDPEPEFVDIDPGNRAAVSLQENNHVIVDLPTSTVVADWSAGSTTHPADLTDDGIVAFDDELVDARREPDGIAWTPEGRLVTANEGDYDLDLEAGAFVGGRDFTIFEADGVLSFEPGSAFEEALAAAGRYPDDRSDDRGSEPEGVEVAWFGETPLAFVGAERADAVVVYSLDDETTPMRLQTLETGDAPEGLLAVPDRSLFVTANEDDGTLSIFRGDFPPDTATEGARGEVGLSIDPDGTGGVAGEAAPLTVLLPLAAGALAASLSLAGLLPIARRALEREAAARRRRPS